MLRTWNGQLGCPQKMGGREHKETPDNKEKRQGSMGKGPCSSKMGKERGRGLRIDTKKKTCKFGGNPKLVEKGGGKNQAQKEMCPVETSRKKKK